MASVSMAQVILEIEPYRIESHITASPATFPVDNYTLAYVVPRYIVLHCIPLREEKFIAFPANVQAVEVCPSPDGELFVTLEIARNLQADEPLSSARSNLAASEPQYLPNQAEITAEEKQERFELGIYAIATQKRVSTVLLDEMPHKVEFGRENKSIILFYPSKTIFLAWERAEIDEVFDHKNGVCCIEKTTFSEAILVDEKLEILFFRHQDGEFREYAPTRLFGRLRRQIVGCSFVSQHMSCLIGNNGELFIFNAPRFLGFIQARKEPYETIESFPLVSRDYLEFEGSITCFAFKGRRVLLGSNTGEICLLELEESIPRFKSNLEDGSDRIIMTGDFVDTDEVDAALDKLSRAVSDLFGGTSLPEYPFKLLQQSKMSSSIRNVSMCYQYAVVEGADGVIYTWEITDRSLVECESTLSYRQTAENALVDGENDSHNAVTLKGLDQLTPAEIEQYERIIRTSDDLAAETALSQRVEDERDVAAVSTDILMHEIIDELDPECKNLKIGTATAPTLIADVITGIPQTNFPPEPLFEYKAGPRSAIYQTHVLPAAYRLGDACKIRNIKLSRLNAISDQAAVVTGDNELIVFTASSLDIFARFMVGADVLDFELHPSGLLLYAVYSEGIGMFVCYAGCIELVEFVTLNGVRKIELSHGGGFVVAACDIGVPVSVKLLDDDLHFLRQLNCHNERIAHMQLLPGDAVIVTVSDDGACYGHLLGSFKRVFECLLRGVQVKSFFVVSESQLQHGAISEEIELVDDVSGGLQTHEVFCNKVEDFLLCGIDADNRFHEIANGRQLHEITLPVTVTSHALVCEPSGQWDIPYITKIAEANEEDELSAIEREGLPASSSVFNKNVAEAVEKGTKLQLALPENPDIFHGLGDAIGAERNETFVGRPIKFVLFGLADGSVVCYEYPIRGSDCIFRIAMCDSAVIGLHIAEGTVLVVVSRNSVVLCNLRFLLPASSIFGSNVRNKSLSRLKQLFDQSEGRKTLVRLPLIRMLPPLLFSCFNRDSETTTIYDRFLFDVVIRASETWRYNDFREALLRESARERATALSRLAEEVRRRADEIMGSAEEGLAAETLELEVAETDFKTAHSVAYRAASERYGRIIGEIKDEKIRIERDTENSILLHKAAMESAKQERQERIKEIVDTTERVRAAKEAEIDSLDDILGRSEDILQEELRELEEEREEALEILNKASHQTLSREESAAMTLRSYRALEERRLSEIKAEIAMVQTEITENVEKEEELNYEVQTAKVEREKLLGTLREKDTRLQEREDEIFSLKRELYGLSETHLVLSHEIEQFKSEIRPREELTSDMRTRVAELGSRLEASKGKWATLSAAVKNAREQADTLQQTLRQRTAVLRASRRAFSQLKNELKGIIIDCGPETYSKRAIQLTMRWAEVGSVLRAAAPKESNAATGEFAAEREHLQKRLTSLYQELSAEELRYVTTQASGLDENSALLNEAHRLRDENIALRSQLERVEAMIEAVRVKELAKTVATVTSTIGATNGSPNARARSIDVQDSNSLRLARQSTRVQSQLSQLEAEKFTLRGIVSQLGQIGNDEK